MNKRRILKYIILGIVAVSLATLLRPKQQKPAAEPRDWSQIVAEGVLRAATEYNSVSFYVDGDTLSGFHYALIKAFAREYGLEVEITPEMSFEERMSGLDSGRFDVVAYGILATSELKDSLLLTTPIMLNRQVLVQRKDTTDGSDSLFIKSLLDLGGKTVHIVKGSPIRLRIHNLSNEIGDTIFVEEVEKYGSEQLIAMLAHGDIDYVVCSETLARKAAEQLPQIDYGTAIGFTQFYSWGVSKHSPVLFDSLNTWLERYKPTREFKQLYDKYY